MSLLFRVSMALMAVLMAPSLEAPAEAALQGSGSQRFEAIAPVSDAVVVAKSSNQKSKKKSKKHKHHSHAASAVDPVLANALFSA